MQQQSSGSSLWPRVGAAVVLIPSALLAVFVGGWVLALWVTAAGLAMSREWVRIVHSERDLSWRFALHAAALAASQGLIVLGLENEALAAVLLCALIGSAVAQKRSERAVWVVAGIIFIAIPCLALVYLRQDPTWGWPMTVWLLGVVWATDSAAYLAGSAFGGPKLAPMISPGKTWAGAVAGLGAGVAATIATTQVFALDATVEFVLFGLALSLLTQCGDLAESFLKRTFGVKDASDLIPGHGGALDRLDGMVFATLGLAAFVAITEKSPLVWAFA